MNEKAQGEKKRGQRGPEAGVKYDTTKTNNDWFQVCQAYSRLSRKVSVPKFLKSAESGPKFSGTQSEAQSFSQFNKKFKSGELTPSEIRKNVPSKFPEVEAKLVAYLGLRARWR